MIEVTDAILRQMVEATVDAIDPEQIILFGSRATGKAGPDSDVDILIVDSKPFGENRSPRKQLGDIQRLLLDFPFPLDLLLFTRDEVLKWRSSRNHVIGRAMREGKVIYERS
jgi:predicted nucleotidyltransferase